MYMLGYEVDFGHMEAVNLISSAKYSEKSVGYAWCAPGAHTMPTSQCALSTQCH